MQCIVTFDTETYQNLPNISSETHILNFGCLSSGYSIYENMNVRTRDYFLKPKGVRKQKCLRNTVLDELENQDVLAPKISRRHEYIYTADATYRTYKYEGRHKCTTRYLVENHANTTGYCIIGGHLFFKNASGTVERSLSRDLRPMAPFRAALTDACHQVYKGFT